MKFPARTRRIGIFLTTLTLAALTLGGVLESAPVDPERQSSVFKRIFSYDKHLRDTEKIIVIIVSDRRDGEECQQVATVFREKGLFPAVVTEQELHEDLTATLTPRETVLYITESVDPSLVKAFAAAKGFLTISGQPTMAEAGHVSVSVDVAGDRPEIVVNMARLETEGHELSAELLKLARVIR